MLSLADDQALQFAAEDNAKVLWDKIRETFIGLSEDRLDVSPRELVYHTVRGLDGKFSKVCEILKTKRKKPMEKILQILREEETTINLSTKERINAEAFYSRRKTFYREEKLCDNTSILDSGATCHMAKESVWLTTISPEVMEIYLADKNSKMMRQGTGNVSAKTVSTKHCNSTNLTITNVSYVPQLRFPKVLRNKFEVPGRRGIMLGYARERRGYRIYDIKNQKVIEERSVKFNESLKDSSYLGEIENETWDIDSFFEVTPETKEINENTKNEVSSNFEINNGPVAIENDNSILLQTTSSPQTSRIQLPVFELNDVQIQIPDRRSERLKSKQMSVHLTDNVPNSYFEAKNSANW
ncbi:retrovirus-related Pol polyprotein from transposon TNT 1-94 [Trichonephila clavipes]|nr:retrovirus-related Pol polyprotein from transposon TNT 1-94 [Trichonephila clavipes]